MSIIRPPMDDPQTYDIIGAAMAVHRELGCGFLEARLPIRYRNHLLSVCYRVDLICHGEILVEVKAIPAIGPIEHAQAINYLRAAKQRRALLLNFGATSLQHKRVVYE